MDRHATGLGERVLLEHRRPGNQCGRGQQISRRDDEFELLSRVPDHAHGPDRHVHRDHLARSQRARPLMPVHGSQGGGHLGVQLAMGCSKLTLRAGNRDTHRQERQQRLARRIQLAHKDVEIDIGRAPIR